MGRNSCCVKQKLRKGLWSPEEDEKLYNYITRFGVGCWSSVPKLAGLQRCGKSCRLRWINYLRPDLKRGMFSQQEEELIINLHETLGNRWAQIAAQLPGRTDNEIKNFWNSSLKKKLLKQGVDPNTHKPMNAAVIKDERERDERECAAAVPVQILNHHHHQHHQEMLPPSNSNHQMYNLSSMMYSNGAKMAAARDPLFLSELQEDVTDQEGLIQPCFLSHSQQRPYERESHHHHHPIINPICGFSSMPNLTKFDLAETSRTSRFAMNNEGNSMMMMMNSNNGGLSWDEESKLDSVFQFQFSGIQIEERNEAKITNSDDFDTYSMSVFDHHRI